MPLKRRVARLIKGPHAGSIISVILVLWGGFVFVGPPIGIGTAERLEYFGYLFVGAIGAAGYTVFRLTRENSTLRARTWPKVSIAHVAGQIPYYVRQASLGGGAIERRHMIGIVNESSSRIDAIRIMPERFEPYMQGATWLDRPLHPLGANTDGSGWFELSVGDGGPTRYVEVFQEIRGVLGCNESLLTYIYDSHGINSLRRYLIGDWFAIVARVEGDMPPCRLKLVAKRNALGWFDVSLGALEVTTMSSAAPQSYRVVTLQHNNLAQQVIEPAPTV